MNKVKEFIASLKLRRSDLMLFLGFLPFAIFLIFGQLFMQYHDPNELALKIWMFIPLFVIIVVCWGYYLYLESKAENNPPQLVTWIFAILTVLCILGIAVQPSQVIEQVVVRMINGANTELFPEIQNVGDIITVTINISAIHKVFFILNITSIMVFIYIGLFIFPKRFTGLSFLKYLGYAVFALMGALILYSYIFEHGQYIPFIKTFLGMGDGEHDLYYYTVQSFIIHRNAFGMCMMIGIIFAMINHSIDKKWWYYLIIVYLYISMIFSWCKTGLLISAILIVAYVVFRLIITMEEHKKRNIRIFIVLGIIALLGILALGVAYLSKGKYLGFLYNLIDSFLGTSTLDFRSYIWDNSYQLLRNGWWIIGRGFGTYSMMILKMNSVNGDIVFPAHSAYVGLLSEGGIFYLLGYFALVSYTIYCAVKAFKYNPNLTFAMCLGALSFFLYSTTEEIQYLVYLFMFPIIILYHLSKNSRVVNN